MTAKSFDRHYYLNVKGLLLATQAVVKLFPKEGAWWVNISSGVAKTRFGVAKDIAGAQVGGGLLL